MKPTPRDVRWLVDQLDDQKRRLQNLENRKPSLAYSSIEDGAIREYDKDGTLGSQTGKQPDGTHGNVVYNGPPPPTPTMAKVAAVPGVVEVRWNGKFADDAVSPLDFKHVAAYVVPVGAPVVLSAQSGVMTGELGDALQVQVDAGVHDVYLASWSKAGRYSALAGPVAVAVPVPADMDAIQEALDDLDERYDGVITEAGNLGNRLDTAETELVDHEARLVENDASLDILEGEILPALELDLEQAKTRLTSAETALAPLPGKVADAEAELTEAQGSISSLVGRTSTVETAQTTMQGDLTRVEGLANTAQSTANGATTVSVSPPTPGDAVGKPASAMWIQRVGGAQVGAWYKSPSSGEWTTLPFDPVMIPQVNIGTGTFGEFDGVRLKAGTVQADRLSVGASANSITDPGFVSLDISANRANRSTGTWTRGFAAADYTNYYRNQTVDGTANWHFYPLDTAVIGMPGMIPTDAGTQWTFRAEINSDGMAARFAVFYVNRDGTTGTVSAGADTTGGFARRVILGDWTAQSTVMGFQPFIIFTGAARAYVYGGASARPKMGAVHIERGAVTADAVNAQSVAGVVGEFVEARVDKLTAGSANVNAAVIQKLAVQIATIIELHADRITVGKLTSGQIDTLNLAAALATILELNADRITAGTVSTARLNAQQIAAATAAFQTVDVKNLFATTGTISELVAKKIWADLAIFNKVTTQILAIGAFDNLVVDPDFVDAGLTGARVGASSGSPVVGASDDGRKMVTIAASVSQASFKMLANDANRGLPVVPDAVYRIRYQAKSAGGSASTRPAVTIYRADGTSGYAAVDGGTFAAVTSAWGWYDFTWTAPNNATAAYFDIQRQSGGTGALSIKSPAITRMSGGELVVDGSITAASLAAKAVTTDKLDATAIDGMVITGAIIQSPGAGAGYQLTEGGYTSRDANGNVTVRLPTNGDPNQFKGDIEAQSLTVSGRASFQSANNEIASGATLVLEAGTTPPLTPPTVGVAYAAIPLPTLPTGETASGLAFADGLWWRAVDAAGTDTGDRLEAFNSSGAIVRSYPIGVGTRLNGIAAIGTELYVLGVKHGQPANTRHVLVYGVDGSFKRDWRYAAYGTGFYQPGIGTDGTNIVIAHCESGGNLNWSRWNKTTGVFMDDVNTFDPMKADVVGVHYGAADFGATRVTVSKANGTTEVYTTTGALQSYVGWFSADRRPVMGLEWSGGKFWHLQANAIIGYTGIREPSGAGVGDTDDWWIAATWRGAGGVETTMGPPQRFTFMRRSELQLSAGTLPAGATGARFYLARSAGSPARTGLRLIATVTGSNGRITTLAANWATQANPPATNTFSAASPGLIRSRANNFQVDGAGAGKWGPLTFNADGTMVGRGTILGGSVLHDAIPPNGGSKETVITFPVGRYSVPPIVLTSVSNGRANAVIDALTASSFILRTWNFTSINVVGGNMSSWTAIEN